MAQLTYAEMAYEVMALIELEGTVVEDSVRTYLNWAGRRLWYSRKWYERTADKVVQTVAPVTTGTVTLTNGSDAVVGVGTAFAATMASNKRRLARGIGQPWYEITGFTNATNITLGRNYLEATAAGASHVVYQDVYSLGSDVDAIKKVALLLDPARGPVGRMSQRALDNLAVMPAVLGIPQVYSLGQPNASGYRQVRVYPVPDRDLAMYVRYDKGYTDMSADGDLCVCGTKLESLVIEGALLWAQKLQDAAQVITEAEWLHKVEDAWREHQAEHPVSGNRRPFDAPIAAGGRYYEWPAS